MQKAQRFETISRQAYSFLEEKVLNAFHTKKQNKRKLFLFNLRYDFFV